jgi:hypothetical protein
MRLRVLRADVDVRPCFARLPFRFGAATVTAAPLLTARVVCASDAGEVEGLAGDFAMPRWFDKDPSKSPEESSNDLIASARHAAAAYRADAGGTAFELWRAAYARGPSAAPPGDRLVRGFGVALFERALLDAACRAAGLSFRGALAADTFGFRPGEVLPELADWNLNDDLPAPAASIRVRHTIGGADPLRADDVPPEKRVADGLPVALADDIARYGLESFKIKLSGDPRADARRLFDVADVLDEFVGARLAEVTLDANERYADLAELGRVLDILATSEPGARLLAHVAFVEQPLDRARSFDPALTAALKALPVPAILDEADHGIEAFPRALALGYSGVSAKNCKGVFRTLLNRGVCARRGGFQSAEDLTNVPVLPLHQDLATVALLGLPHVERNGHHYFRGLDHLTAAERAAALAHHPELYAACDDGVFLRIERGRLDLSALDASPGYASAAAHAAR